MSRRKRKQIDPAAFLAALHENEDHMAEMAAFAVTCERFDITEEQGYDLLAEAGHAQ